MRNPVIEEKIGLCSGKISIVAFEIIRNMFNDGIRDNKKSKPKIPEKPAI